MQTITVLTTRQARSPREQRRDRAAIRRWYPTAATIRNDRYFLTNTRVSRAERFIASPPIAPDLDDPLPF